MRRRCPHFGQGPFFPAALSGTLSRALQTGQLKRIMAYSRLRAWVNQFCHSLAVHARNLFACSQPANLNFEYVQTAHSGLPQEAGAADTLTK